MDEKPKEQEPKGSEKPEPGKNAPEIKEHKEPEPEIKQVETEDRFQSTDMPD